MSPLDPCCPRSWRELEEGRVMRAEMVRREAKEEFEKLKEM